MTILDWALLVLWLGITLSGFWKGAVRLVFGAGGVLFGVWLALVAGAELSRWLAELVQLGWLAAVLGRLLPILACLLVFGLAGWGIDRTLRALRLGWLNRLGGALLAALVAALLLAALLTVAVSFSPTWAKLCEESTLAPYLLKLSRSLGGAI